MIFKFKTSTFSRLFLALLVCTVGLSLFAAGSIKADELLFNDAMEDQNYTSFSFNASEPETNMDDISESFVTFTNNGNPGDAMEVEHFHDVDRDGGGEPINGNGGTSLQSFIRKTDFNYNPSVSGNIIDLTFSIDVRTTDDFGRVFFSLNDANGGNAAGFTNIVTDGQWQTITVSGLAADDFSSRDFSGNLPMDFGFGFTSVTDVTVEPISNFIEADNFSVSANVIPEPSSLSVIGICGLVCVLSRRRKNRCQEAR